VRHVPGLSGHGVFLSYRRADAAPYARLLRSQLMDRLPDVHVMDVDPIEPSLEFAEDIRKAVESCAVLVALIGRQWETLADEEGRRRIDNVDDYVRAAIRTALQQGKRVIPLLVDGAQMPRQQQLPSDLRQLARLNALDLSYDRYGYDTDRFIYLIERVLGAAPPGSANKSEFPAFVSQDPVSARRSTDVRTAPATSHLDGRQLKAIHNAIVSNYTHEALDRDLLFELNKRLEAISAPDSLPNVVFRVLKAAEWQGWLLELLRMLRNTGYLEVRETAARILTELGPSQWEGTKGQSSVRSHGLRVFLCHSSSDKGAVRALRTKLLTDGIRPWLDEEDILPGENWEEAIRKAIRASDMVLVCLSATSVSKIGYLQKEIKSVLDVADEQPEGNIFLIPVRLDPCDVPSRLSEWQWVDLFDEGGYQRLMRSLRSRDSG
jgi:hypothetical protein